MAGWGRVAGPGSHPLNPRTPVEVHLLNVQTIVAPEAATVTTTTESQRPAVIRWLEGHPNWAKLGPRRKEGVALLALNEYNVETNTLSTSTRRELAEKYPGYPEVFWKNTYAALRRYGIARPVEKYEPASCGRRQVATHYLLEAEPNGEAWRGGGRAQRAANTQRGNRVGKLEFSRQDDFWAERQMRNRRTALSAGWKLG